MSSGNQYNLSSALLGLGEDELRRKGQQTGWIQRRGDKWHIFYRELAGAEDGKARWRPTSRVVGDATGPEKISKAEALRRGREQFVNRANGLTITPGSLATVAQFIEARYRPDHIEKLRPGTAADYESIIRLYILPPLGACQLRDVTRPMVQVILNSADRAGRSSQRVCHIRNVLSSIFRHARRMNYFSGDLPTSDVIVPTMRRTERQALTDEQIEILLLHITDQRIRTAIHLMYRLGLRAGEMAGLRWQCVNLSQTEVQWVDGMPVMPGQMWIREQYSRNSFAPCKTAKSNRRFLMPSDVLGMLERLKERSQFTSPEDTVFASRDGRPMDHHNVLKRTLKPACIKAGIPWASWHHFRHTAATNMDQVMTVHESMAILGHSSPKMTATYTHAQQKAMLQKFETMPVRTPKN